MQIDIEGYDADIILTSDFKTIRPKYIRYESVHIMPHISENIKQHLQKFGYEVVEDKFWKTYDQTIRIEEPTWDV